MCNFLKIDNEFKTNEKKNRPYIFNLSNRNLQLEETLYNTCFTLFYLVVALIVKINNLEKNRDLISTNFMKDN